jgi:hypothetical protein
MTGVLCCPLPFVTVGEFCPTSPFGVLLAFSPLWLTVWLGFVLLPASLPIYSVGLYEYAVLN